MSAGEQASGSLLSMRNLTVSYLGSPVVQDVNMDIEAREVTALIGPTGTGKTSLLLAMNRMLDLNPHAEVSGRIILAGEDIADSPRPVEDLRRRLSYIGPRPACFPRSIWDNVAWGPRVNGFSGDLESLIEESLRKAGLWSEVRGMLRRSALRLSGGQRQRLCLARALAVSPDALLLDEPTSRLDPIAGGRIEDVVISLKDEIGVIIAAHDHLQAGRLAEKTALFLPGPAGCGELVEFSRTDALLVNPEKRRTEDYITGKHSQGRRYPA